MDTTPPPYHTLAYDIKTAVRVSGVTRTAIYEAIQSGALRARKLGIRTFILHEDLQSWLNGLKVYDPQNTFTPNSRRRLAAVKS